jgi:hypothetical protein
MEGALFSTVYRGCPFSVAGRSPPHHTVAAGGLSSSLSLNPRSGSRAVGTLSRGKCRRCISSFVFGVWQPPTTHCVRADEEVILAIIGRNRRGRQGDCRQIDPLQISALGQPKLGATSFDPR